MTSPSPRQTLFPPGARIKLVNGRFADVAAGQFYPTSTSLVIQDGKIAAMPGMHGEPDDTPAEFVINLQGKSVIPGLFNTHAHIQIISGMMDKGELRQRQIAKNLSDCLERGITHVRDTLCWDLAQNREIKDKISRGDLAGPRLHQAIHVSPVGGTYAPKRTFMKRTLFSFLGLPLVPYSSPGSGAVVFRKGASPQEVRDAVDRAIFERGAEMIKFCDQPEHFMSYKPGAVVMTWPPLEAAADQARKRGIPTTIHNVTAEGFRQSLRAGVDSLAHLPIDQELTGEDLALFAASHTSIEPTLTVGFYYCWSMIGNPWRDHPEIQRLDGFRDSVYEKVLEESWLPEVRPGYRAQRDGLHQGSMKIYGLIDLSGPFQYFASIQPVGGKNFERIYAAGGRERCACGNDATVSACSQAAIHLEMELFDFSLNRDGNHVFSGADALRTASIQSARALGLDKLYGSIEAGKVADLAVMDGDPFEDFHCVGSPVAALFMDGRLVVDHCGL
ncbi:MAG: hypothetical protein EHM70_18735, partial [Chloroflexota bacterium]